MLYGLHPYCPCPFAVALQIVYHDTFLGRASDTFTHKRVDSRIGLYHTDFIGKYRRIKKAPQLVVRKELVDRRVTYVTQAWRS